MKSIFISLIISYCPFSLYFIIALCCPSHLSTGASKFHRNPTGILSLLPPPLFPVPSSPVSSLSRRWSNNRWSSNGNLSPSWSWGRCWCQSRGWSKGGRRPCPPSPCEDGLGDYSQHLLQWFYIILHHININQMVPHVCRGTSCWLPPPTPGSRAAPAGPCETRAGPPGSRCYRQYAPWQSWRAAGYKTLPIHFLQMQLQGHVEILMK